MKKIAIFMVAIVVFAMIGFAGCGKNDNLIRLSEVTHSIFYAPLYVAINNGYFEQEGLEIELTDGGGADNVMAALLSGSADVGLMGPEASIYVVQGDSNNKPVVFGQLTKRDGSLLVGRVSEPNFKWSDTVGKEIIGGRRGGVPAMTLQYVLDNINGLEIGDGTGGTVKLNLDVAFNMTAAAFEGGQGDYVTMFEPLASEYQRQGKGYIVASVGEASGDVPFTAFTALSNYVGKNKQKIEKFLKAVIKGYGFISTANDDQIYEALAPSFPNTSKQSILDSVNSYMSIDAWSDDLIMSEEAFDNLQNIMTNAGELNEKVAFADVVDNTYAINANK